MASRDLAAHDDWSSNSTGRVSALSGILASSSQESVAPEAATMSAVVAISDRRNLMFVAGTTPEQLLLVLH